MNSKVLVLELVLKLVNTSELELINKMTWMRGKTDCCGVDCIKLMLYDLLLVDYVINISIGICG